MNKAWEGGGEKGERGFVSAHYACVCVGVKKKKAPNPSVLVMHQSFPKKRKILLGSTYLRAQFGTGG